MWSEFKPRYTRLKQQRNVTMKIKMQTDYAIRILIYLSDKQEKVVTKEMASALGISEYYLPKITQRLRNAGILGSSAGTTGGFVLLRKPEDITLFDVMQVMEDTVKFNRCLEDDEYCSRYATKTCPVHGVFQVFQNMMEWYFSSLTIQDLLKPKKESMYDGLPEKLADLIRLESQSENQ